MVEHYSNRFPCRKTVSFLCQQGLNGKNGHSRLADIVNFCWNSASVTKKIKIPLAKNILCTQEYVLFSMTSLKQVEGMTSLTPNAFKLHIDSRTDGGYDVLL
jgi:hypothetical protein